jgi:pimeloyl-ACP methyl ester carboxylesterase
MNTMKPFIYLIFLFLYSCTNDVEKYEYIIKNDTFRNSIDTGNFIKLSNGYTYYELSNMDDDEIIVLIHGFSVPLYIWDETYFESIKRGYGVIRLDLYGRGYSDNPDIIYNDELYANQVVELIEKLGVTQKINLVGLSNGGRVISKIAFDYPELIKRLVYVSPAGFHNKKLFPDTSQVTDKDIKQFINNNYSTISKGQLLDFKDPSKFIGWDTKYDKLLEYKGFARALISTTRNNYSLDNINQHIGLSSLPQYAIWGDSDKVLPLDKVKIKLSSIMPQLKLFVIKNSGHLPNKEQFDDFNNVFFNKILSDND